MVGKNLKKMSGEYLVHGEEFNLKSEVLETQEWRRKWLKD